MMSMDLRITKIMKINLMYVSKSKLDSALSLSLINGMGIILFSRNSCLTIKESL